MKYKCLVCGQVFDVPEGETPQCPVCKVTGDKLVPYKEEAMTWPAEHAIGIAKGVDAEIVEGLRNHFNGECSEVGMYLAMSRQALREGYPEIAELFRNTLEVEKYHRDIFKELYEQMTTGTLYEKDKEVVWICADCGYMEKGKTAWEECPLCQAKRGSLKLILKAKMINCK